ncbi:MAG TPA: MBL fold metallo-hydrolase [Vicinamibacteria bacterium]|nr:MBL fold metallo-hydrolase [Vicinamibacteria bacterium]
MADPRRRHPANVPGPWFVDTTCIDCDACRQVAPGVFDGGRLGQSAVARQPGTADEERAAERALVACPTASIGVQGRRLRAEGLFPQELDAGVFYCGYNSADSYGANAFLALRRDGNLLVDSPRFAAPLVRAMERLGGVAHVLLTHQDDVADAQRFAAPFGSRVWIHEADSRAAPFASDLLRGTDPVSITSNVRAIPVPGHTRGSVAYLADSRYLFSGDSLYWSRAGQDLGAFRDACWYSWPAQADSLERLAAHPFEWVLAGHGDRQRRPAPEMAARLRALVARMRGRDEAASW